MEPPPACLAALQKKQKAVEKKDAGEKAVEEKEEKMFKEVVKINRIRCVMEYFQV
ncbi:hypothetical protein [Methanosarcina lacustris]|uniref:hypothetical protein n=1 Tax=Methanosarcina lacustris TaxID=170861 RepID=UPI000B2FFD7E|nr:hypothetical protein [Methanosarcina lacustris]